MGRQALHTRASRSTWKEKVEGSSTEPLLSSENRFLLCRTWCKMTIWGFCSKIKNFKAIAGKQWTTHGALLSVERSAPAQGVSPEAASARDTPAKGALRSDPHRPPLLSQLDLPFCPRWPHHLYHSELQALPCLTWPHAPCKTSSLNLLWMNEARCWAGCVPCTPLFGKKIKLEPFGRFPWWSSG